MIDFINSVFPVLMFSISTGCVLVLLMYFFKKESLLRRLGFMKSNSLFVLWVGLAYSIVFGLLGTIPAKPGELSIGVQAVLVTSSVLFSLVGIVLLAAWRSNIKAS